MNVVIVAFVVALYANLAPLVGRALGIGSGIVGAAILALILVPAAYQLVVRRSGFVVDIPWLLLISFQAPLVVTTILSKNPGISLQWMMGFALEVILVYLAILNSVRSRSALRHAIWGLVAAAAFLSALCSYQELAHAQNQQFGGLAQRNFERGEAVEARQDGTLMRSRDHLVIANRALGPIGDPNRFAQVLLFALPLAGFRIRDEKKRWLRIVAAGCTLAILSGVFLTYSRGGFVALAGLVFVALLQGYLRWRHVIIVGVLGFVLACIVAPGSLLRLQKLQQIPALLSDREFAAAGDGAVRGRMTEMLAAYHVFLDHPLFGVGPGHYARYYSVDYMEKPEVAFRALAGPRRAHSLYIELAAETGLVGLMAFLTPIFGLLVRLEMHRRRWSRVRPELAHLAASFELAILSYLGSGVFLHLAYQTYLGLLLGLSGTAVQLLEARRRERAVFPSPIDLPKLVSA